MKKHRLFLSILLFLLSSTLFAEANIVFKALFEQVYDRPPFDPSIAPVIKKESPGERYVRETREKNRKILKERAKGPLPTKLDFLTEMKKKERESHQKWRKTRDDTYRLWAREHQQFLKRVDGYKENLVNFEETKGLLTWKPVLTSPPKDEFYIIKDAFASTIGDQGRRPTCSAFAATGALEILLKQKGKEDKLSSQYFYWSSKPDCQTENCSVRGSWIVSGLEFSKKSLGPNIPLEKVCPYSEKPIKDNETQLPLPPGCFNGKVKVNKFKYLNTLDDIILALKDNYPVIGAFKLSDNFYTTSGLVLPPRGTSFSNRDSHAKGHALSIIGYIKIPSGEKQDKGGRLCLIIKNSWGIGYGQGGYSCISEKWFFTHRISIPFVAITSISD